ncbi:LuxR C-terminal-related transcriptional regulator (plasmid) [Streptomyces sp. BHT-5-2]|uniref:helix-turn-helix transcriptional regulator n=1 Tax=unclassified Streptomyces TaxID=2593676 RepID=UPI001C8DA373|nr:LuxR C-terminal-related transcriptional regulator [Streptomyces sp. BHT-5-2]QZL08667.1 LuxR C-terminal-related transcriptional regulator [Streptomyces sp. BHT-5-2]
MFASTPEIRSMRCFSEMPAVDELSGYDVLVLGLHSRRDLGLLRLAHDLAVVCRLVLLCTSVTTAAALALLDAGADGYLTTDADAMAFREAVLRVARGHTYLHRPVAELIRGNSRPVTPKLAPREVELLGYLAIGLTHAQAARRMGVAVGTVETYVRRVRAKCAISGPIRLARVAREARLQLMLGCQPN